MATFLKANISSLFSTVVDYLATILLVTFFHLDAVVSSATGNVIGGIANFFIGRRWVFKSREDKVHEQAFRYVLVWVGNLILNATGMYLLIHVAKINYIVSKLIVSIIVGFGYNYFLQKKFVFKKPVV